MHRQGTTFVAASFLLLLSLPHHAIAQKVSTETAVDRAWSMLSHKVAASEPEHDRIQALAALGTMGYDPRAAKLIGDAIVGHDRDVRTAAILAAEKTKNPELIARLREALDDERPQVAYAAATTLWKMHDESGEDLLLAVVSGERRDQPGLIGKEKHKAAKEMHNPKALAKIGIDQASGYFLGPFGFGVTAIEFIHKNGGDPARAAAVDLLAQQHTQTVHGALIAALKDHDFAVRAAAAKGLGEWPGEDTQRELLPLFDDDKLAVRLTAAASYIRITEPAPEKPEGPRDPKLVHPAHPESGLPVSHEPDAHPPMPASPENTAPQTPPPAAAPASPQPQA